MHLEIFDLLRKVHSHLAEITTTLLIACKVNSNRSSNNVINRVSFCTIRFSLGYLTEQGQYHRIYLKLTQNNFNKSLEIQKIHLKWSWTINLLITLTSSMLQHIQSIYRIIKTINLLTNNQRASSQVAITVRLDSQSQAK